MKKFLAILLLAVISCTIIDDLKAEGIITAQEDVDMEGLTDFLKRLWEKIKEIWRSIPGKIQQVINFLKEHGYWSTLIDLIKKYGVKYGTEYCEKYLEHDLCVDAVQWLFDLLNAFK